MERRITDAAEIAIETRADGQKMLVGYAAVFYRKADPGTQYQLWQGLVERIAPAAFDRALKEKQDVRALFNHDSNFPLGRLGAETLRLLVNSKGLKYEIDLPDTQAGRDVAKSVERRDVPGSSFAFLTRKESFEREGDLEVRSLLDVDLIDVGPVVFPAYKSTTAGLRAEGPLDEARAAYARWQQRQAIAARLERLAAENR